MSTKRQRRQGPLAGTIAVPGDKSVSHRALLLAALAPGRSVIRGLNTGLDVAATITAMRALGVSITSHAEGEVEVESLGRLGLGEPGGVIDAANSGTTARTLLGIAAGLDAHLVITGDDALRRRPMLRVVAPLRQMGARVDGRAHGDLLPVSIRGGSLAPLDHEPDVPSAQVKTAVLLAGLAASGITSVREPVATRDHTERMLRAAGVEVTATGTVAAVVGPALPSARDWQVPGDISAALFLAVAASLVPGSDVVIGPVGLNPTRTRGIELLGSMGAEIDIELDEDLTDAEPVGMVRVRHAPMKGIDIDAGDVARAIDEIPALVIAASQAEGVTRIKGAAELRNKESDRVAALVEGLRSLGAPLESTEDGLVIDGPLQLSGGDVDSRGDHRIAMAFAVAGLVAAGPVRVRGWSSVDVSFPGFADTLAAAGVGRS